MSIISEFREFALKGSVVDLAVGVIIGAAFNGIVQSLVNDLVMPPIGWITGGLDFSDLVLTLPPSPLAPGAELVTINYGKFITTLISFVIVAWVIFWFVKMINRMKRKQEIAPAPADVPADIKLLTEIRDLLKART